MFNYHLIERLAREHMRDMRRKALASRARAAVEGHRRLRAGVLVGSSFPEDTTGRRA